MRKWYPAFLFAVTVLISVIAYPKLPARVPTHWSLDGEINGYSSRWVAAILMPLLLIVIWASFRALPKFDPRAANYAKFESAYDLMMNAILTTLVFIHVIIIVNALGYPVAMNRIVPIVIGLLFIMIGNVLPKARPNWFVGIRTPWTLSNDRVWERTHRVGGYLLVGAGVLTACAAFAPPVVAIATMTASVGIAALGSVIYSYFAWRQETSA